MLANCGFHLRGQARLPPELAVTYIKAQRAPGSPSGNLAGSLERTLQANGVEVTTDQKAATATLEILQEGLRSRALAAGTQATSTTQGQIREYTLTYSVNYQVTRADGSKLISPETLSASRNLLYDETKVLGRAAGEEILVREMVSDLARSILLRLQAVSR